MHPVKPIPVVQSHVFVDDLVKGRLCKYLILITYIDEPILDRVCNDIF